MPRPFYSDPFIENDPWTRPERTLGCLCLLGSLLAVGAVAYLLIREVL